MGAGRNCTRWLRVGKYHLDFELVTNLCCRVVGEGGCYNHATHRDADTGDGVTAHSPDLKVAQSQRVCITDVFVENYMTLHGILSIGDKRNQKRGKKKNLFNFLQSLLGTNVEHEIRQLKESPPCDLGQ